MAKEKEKIHIVLVGRNLNLKTKEYKEGDGCFIFEAKIKIGEMKKEEKREIVLYPGANTDVLIHRPVRKKSKKKQDKETKNEA